MIPVLAFFRQYWRTVGLVILALLLASAGWQGWQFYNRHRLAKKVAATVQQHAARAAGEARHRSNFDSAFYAQAGQRRELARTLAKLKHLDDSLNHRLPAAPALPALPPRQ